MTNKKCLLCGAPTEIKHDKYPGYQEPLVFEIYHCESCSTAFSLPRLNDTKIIYDNIYKNGTNVPGYDRYWRYAEDVKYIKKPLKYLAKSENTYWGIREALRQIVTDKKETKILEVGSGLGYLTYALNKEGYNTLGVDISATAVDQAKQNYGNYYFCNDIFSYAEKKKECYDIVILTEVIEHVNEPIEFLKALLKTVKPKGYVLLTTPNKSIFSSDVIWASDNPPIHCWWFSEKSICIMADKLNTSVSFIDFKKFHKKNFIYLSNNIIPTMPIFNKNGKVIYKSNATQAKTFLIRLKKLIFKRIVFLEKVNIRMKKRHNPAIIICNKRSIVLCALLQKDML